MTATKGKKVLMAAGAVAAVLVHLMLGTWAVLAASGWAAGVAIGSAVTVAVVLHVAGLRRLAARRAAETAAAGAAGAGTAHAAEAGPPPPAAAPGTRPASGDGKPGDFRYE